MIMDRTKKKMKTIHQKKTNHWTKTMNIWNENRRSCLCNDDLCLSRVTGPGWYSGQNEDYESDEDNDSDDDNHDRVCLCDPTDFNAGTCC